MSLLQIQGTPYHRHTDTQTHRYTYRQTNKQTNRSPLINAVVLQLLCINSQLVENTVGSHVIDARAKLNITGKMKIYTLGVPLDVRGI